MSKKEKIINGLYAKSFVENEAKIQKDLDKLTEETISKINKEVTKKTFLQKLFEI